MIMLEASRQLFRQVVMLSERRVAAVGDKGCYVWSLDSDLAHPLLLSADGACNIAALGSGMKLIVGEHDGLHIHDLSSETMVQIDHPDRLHGGAFNRLVGSPTEELFVTGFPYSGWLITKGKAEQLWIEESSWFRQVIGFTSDGQRIIERTTVGNRATANRDRLVYRDPHTGREMETVPMFSCPAGDLYASPDGQRVVCVAFERLAVWEATNQHRQYRMLPKQGRKHFTGVAFHFSNRFFAATNNDTTVKFYDTQTWTVAKTFTWNIGRLRSIAFSPDGLLAAAGSDTGKVVVWDVDV